MLRTKMKTVGVQTRTAYPQKLLVVLCMWKGQSLGKVLRLSFFLDDINVREILTRTEKENCTKLNGDSWSISGNVLDHLSAISLGKIRPGKVPPQVHYPQERPPPVKNSLPKKTPPGKSPPQGKFSLRKSPRSLPTYYLK